MNPFPSWFCINSSKNLFVKVVYPCGLVELHDRPILAAELLNRNPKCCVAHPTVFNRPYAIVSPTATLKLGQRYYVMPIIDPRKLQLKCCPSQGDQNDHKQKAGKRDGKEVGSGCWWKRCNKKNDQKVRIGKERAGKDSTGHGHGGNTGSVTSLDHWQPGLESVIEE